MSLAIAKDPADIQMQSSWTYVDPVENSNKFWHIELHIDGSVWTSNGRIGETTQVRKLTNCTGEIGYRRKIQEKRREGYTELDLLDDKRIKLNGRAPDNIEDLAVKQIARGNKQLAELVRYLVQENGHQIARDAELVYDAKAGTFSTALGIVTRETIGRARQKLSLIRTQVSEGINYGINFQILVSDYMRLIPMRVGRKLRAGDVFPDLAAVIQQFDLLDRLTASLDLIEAAGLKKVKAKQPKLFDLTFEEMGRDELDRVTQYWMATRQSEHDSYSARPIRVFLLDIHHSTLAYQHTLKTLGNEQIVWHGSNISHMLSIFSQGLIVPRHQDNGRAYQNGIYGTHVSTKAGNYSWDKGKNRSFVILAKFAMGKPWMNAVAYTKWPVGCDSAWAHPGSGGVLKYDELIVPRAEQCAIFRLVELGL